MAVACRTDAVANGSTSCRERQYKQYKTERPIADDMSTGQTKKPAKTAFNFLYPQLGRPDEPRFRDRFTSRLSTPTAQRVREFVELTFANELDVLRHDEDLLRRNGPALADLFVRCRELVSVAAYDAFRRFVDARLHSFGESREVPARRD